MDECIHNQINRIAEKRFSPHNDQDLSDDFLEHEKKNETESNDPEPGEAKRPVFQTFLNQI